MLLYQSVCVHTILLSCLFLYLFIFRNLFNQTLFLKLLLQNGIVFWCFTETQSMTPKQTMVAKIPHFNRKKP